MGKTVVAAVDADPELELVAAVDPATTGDLIGAKGLTVAPEPGSMEEAGVEVAVDFTVAEAALDNAAWCADHGVHAVIGTTGLSGSDLDDLRGRFEASDANCIVAPNFAIGAVLMMYFAELAAPWFAGAEVVELHHDTKVDAPSGTALLTARRVAAARSGAARSRTPAATRGAREPGPARGMEAADGVQVHSVRLPGLVSHQEVLFGNAGEVLTVRHDSLDRGSFMPGVLLAIKQVPARRGLTLGLEVLLGL